LPAKFIGKTNLRNQQVDKNKTGLIFLLLLYKLDDLNVVKYNQHCIKNQGKKEKYQGNHICKV
jgi:hypothetical protein